MKIVISSKYIVVSLILVFGFLLFTIYSLLPTVVLAQTTCTQDPNKPGTEYCLLAPIPLTNPGGRADTKTNTQDFIPGLFKLTIALATALAVIMLIFAGIKYMSTDAFTDKEEAKGVIENALWGLLLTMSAWLILNTINPALVSFNLSLGQTSIRQNVNPPTGGTSAGGGAGGRPAVCVGNCTHSYVNGGVNIRYRDCNSCSDASSFGFTLNQGIVNGVPAQINTDLGNSLRNVQNTSGNPGFRVTETWPPTVNHAAQGQYDGTSVDVALSTPNAANINTFLNNARTNGLRAVYEVQNAGQRQTYINAGVPAANIIVVPRITGEHFSIYRN